MTTRDAQPNILFIMSDDHAAHAITAYGSRINKTPHIDRIAAGGARFNHCYCTNSICTPSRATILTGQYAHRNGVSTLNDRIDGRRDGLVQKHLQHAGYETAIIGKWHLGHGGEADPTGFDHWCVLPGQGAYHNPFMRENGHDRRFTGYVSQVITEQSINWLEQRDTSKPFALMCHHKAPHRPWTPGHDYQHLYENEDIPEPDTLWDDYANRAKAAEVARMRMEDLNETDLKQPVPPGLSVEEERRWRYQRYIKDYLRTVASIDDSVGSLLDYLDAHGLAKNTIVIYTSDQGFFLGDHNWFDKRFMYEQSLQMPFLVRYPKEIPAGSVSDAMLTNTDFAPTMLDYAGAAIPDEMQGVSARGVFRGDVPGDWQQSMYYRYWMHGETAHNTCSHYGVRTHRYKLIYYYAKPLGMSGAREELQLEPEWELFDCEQDPLELNNVYHDPAYAEVVRELTAELERLQAHYGDAPEHEASGAAAG
jgi:arylsulfatase A-like enzyme